MKTELYLQIPKPCHENWDAMTPAAKGRFCASCSKEVVDFSMLTDAEVLNYFKKSTGNTCGRFTNDQLQRPLQETKIEKKKGWKWMLASITSLIMISRVASSCTQQQGKVAIEKPKNNESRIGEPYATTGMTVAQYDSVTEVTSIMGAIMPVIIEDTIPAPILIKTVCLESDIMGDVEIYSPFKKLKLEGLVVDEANQSIPGAVVRLADSAILAYTNMNGHFETTVRENDGFIVIVSSPGFENSTNAVQIQKENKTSLRIIMKQKILELPPVTIQSPITYKLVETVGGVMLCSKITWTDTLKATARKILDSAKITENVLKIYPNPAARNSMIHVSVKQPGSYEIQLFDNASRLLSAEHSATIGKEQPINFQLPGNMAAGVYYIRVINTGTKKSYTDKFIVQ